MVFVKLQKSGLGRDSYPPGWRIHFHGGEAEYSIPVIPEDIAPTIFNNKSHRFADLIWKEKHDQRVVMSFDSMGGHEWKIIEGNNRKSIPRNFLP